MNNLPRGSAHYRAKLTEPEVLVIRKLLRLGVHNWSRQGLSMKRIAEIFGVRYRAIWEIHNGYTWRHVA